MSTAITCVMSIVVIISAARAGPAIVLTELITWLTPATLPSSDLGANRGMDAYIAGTWKALPTERRASRKLLHKQL